MIIKFIRQKLSQLSLEKKLIAAFSVFILIPLTLVAGIVSWIYVNNNRNVMLDAAVENNKQIVTNIDTSLQPLQRLSMFPIQEQSVYQIMKKDYNQVPYPLLERGKDFDKVNGLIQSGIMLYSDLVDSVVIYHEHDQSIIGRSNREYINYQYFKTTYLQEPFIRKIREGNGQFITTGIHYDELLSPHRLPVVSAGRAIMDPYTKERLGFIVFNISADKLKTLWSNTAFAEASNFYLLDEDQRIIQSSNGGEIGKAASAAFGSGFQEEPSGRTGTTRMWINQKLYLISSPSQVAEWHAVTLIAKDDIYSIVYQLVAIMAGTLLLLLILSILISLRIAARILKPLAVLNRKMKLVAQGQLDVRFDTQQSDEVGVISSTVDLMLQEIRSLITRIYEKEEEKRKLEMDALQSQIRPHFIYNTLNVIKWMAKVQGASGIEEALQAFASVMKFSMKTDENLVLIAEEVGFVQSYAKILDFRYFNKFEVTYSIDPAVIEYQTLKFLIQPLVENAIFHGFEGIDYKGMLNISIYERQGDLYVEVADNGRGFPEEGELQAKPGYKKVSRDGFNSIGLQNIRSRIRLHFGPGYGLWIAPGRQGGTVALIRVPVIRNDTAGGRDSK
ncbi:MULTISPECIES: cache domain-containing sensor histidine kinase [Paenibacillus]|uniref:cache domain-containing sensor histidine kinase n=1 Tax=Paenibacillus TaxID=44249 RepID=UPI00048A8010|nr:sensor histidine kinase [Paenibacillus sp. J14]